MSALRTQSRTLWITLGVAALLAGTPARAARVVAPAATTLAATALGSTGATLQASINPGGAAEAYFAYGTSTNAGVLVSTLAGSAAESGFADGPGAAARFTWPRGVAVDSQGNLYVADEYNYCIRKVTPEGAVTTLAGNGAWGHADGTGPAARFADPVALAVDASGNVYVGDAGFIRKVTPEGQVTTLAGSADYGYADGTGPNAQFRLVTGLAVDASGIVYAADHNNHCIRKVTPAGEVTTLAGSTAGGKAAPNYEYYSPDGETGNTDGTGADARFNGPMGVAVDGSGQIYVADWGNNLIRQVTPEGVVTTLAGSRDLPPSFSDGTGAQAHFNAPWGVAVDASANVYVTDGSNHRLRQVTPAGVVTTLAGSGDPGAADGPGPGAQFSDLCGVAVDAHGNVSVADCGNNNLRKIAPAPLPWALAQGGLTGTDDLPVSLALSGLLPATLYYFQAVASNAVATASGDFLSFTTAPVAPTATTLAATALGSTGATLHASLNPGGAAEAYFAYGTSTNDGALVITLAQGGMTGTDALPVSLALAGLLPATTYYFQAVASNAVATARGDFLSFITPVAPAATTLAATANGNTGATLHASINPGGAAEAYFAYGTSTNDGVLVSTLAGSAAESGFADGPGTVARFSWPGGVAVDSQGNLYVADEENYSIRKVAPDGAVTTLAGSGTRGYADGPGSEAQFAYPYGVAVDASGQVYVGDGSFIRKVSPEGEVTTLAGTADYGYTDGPGTNAQFGWVTGVAVDASGNVYAADHDNNCIRKVTPAGEVSTLAGSATGATGDADGTGADARFDTPMSVAVDASGQVYVADYYNHRIRKVTPAGAVTTLAGSSPGFADGTGAVAQFNGPWGVAVDASSNVYVTDESNNRLRQVTPAGVVTTLAGSDDAGSSDGRNAGAQFSYPKGVAVDTGGNLYVGDTGNNTLRKITPAPLPWALAQAGLTGTGDLPVSLTLAGLLPATTYYFQAVASNVVATASGAFLSFTTALLAPAATTLAATALGSTGATLQASINPGGAAEAYFAYGTSTNAGTLVITLAQAGLTGTDALPVSLTLAGLLPTTTYYFQAVASNVVATARGAFLSFTTPVAPAATTLAATGIGSTEATLQASLNPGGAAEAYFAYGTSTNGGMVSTLAGSGTEGGFADGPGATAQFNFPRGVAVDSNGNLYVADEDNYCIRKVTPAGVVTTLAGNGAGGHADGTGAAAQFNAPRGVAVDASGNVYVGDFYLIRKVTPEGVVTTLAGLGGYGFRDGPGATAKFKSVEGLAVDASGNVYAADYGNNRIRKVTPDGVVSTLAGSGASGFSNGPGTRATFNNPSGVAVDGSGHVYVADWNNNLIRKVTPAGVVSTLAGSLDWPSSFSDGTGTAAHFDGPCGVAVDASGNVYVTDTYNRRLRKVSPAGVVTTLAGSDNGGAADGPGVVAQFSEPDGVAVDASGNVYVTDTGNNNLRKIAAGWWQLGLAQGGLTGTSEVPVSLGIAGLLPETTYYFQALASNAVATARGELLSFTTLLAPATENHAPVAVNDTLGGAKNTSSTIAATVFTANDTDADGDALSVTAVTYTGDHGGAVALSGANITYSPAADYAGSDAFTYTISDGHGGTAVGTVAVTVSTSSPGSPNAGGIVADGAKFKLTFQGVGNRTYRVQYATRLTPPDWQDLGTVQASRTGLVLYEDTPPSGASARYYRIVHP